MVECCRLKGETVKEEYSQQNVRVQVGNKIRGERILAKAIIHGCRLSPTAIFESVWVEKKHNLWQIECIHFAKYMVIFVETVLTMNVMLAKT